MRKRGVNNILMKFTGNTELRRDKRNKEARNTGQVIKVISNRDQK